MYIPNMYRDNVLYSLHCLCTHKHKHAHIRISIHIGIHIRIRERLNARTYYETKRAIFRRE